MTAQFVAYLEQYKMFAYHLVIMAGGSDKFVHMNVGLLFWLASALALRRPLHSWVPLLMVLGAEAGNEIVDFSVKSDWTLRDTLLDALATIIWPFAIWLFLSLGERPRLSEALRDS